MVKNKCWQGFVSLLSEEFLPEGMPISWERLRSRLAEEGFHLTKDKKYKDYPVADVVQMIRNWMYKHGECWIDSGLVPAGCDSIGFVSYLVNLGYKERIDNMIAEGYFYGDNPYTRQMDLFQFDYLHAETLWDNTDETYNKTLTLMVEYIQDRYKLKELIETLEDDEDNTDE